ncbi:lipoyl domain-containing protein [Erythrobacter sp. HKB08]|uniref:lipoyl domain-containing protein n=1 Tax=Erythrobacter sp. HKB08 TaxID=2502843 RepID=UPI0013E8E7BB|nr:lipoyl domain-containing protein [Erythrobacter sp. HKB08]
MKQIPFELPASVADFRPVAVERWLVGLNAEFEEGTSLVSVETEIAIVELPSRYPGRLAAVHVDDGGPVSMGDVIATIEVTDWVFENMVCE